eukprot:16439255-Heterocapsa_arctica.AAC.1
MAGREKTSLMESALVKTQDRFGFFHLKFLYVCRELARREGVEGARGVCQSYAALARGSRASALLSAM